MNTRPMKSIASHLISFGFIVLFLFSLAACKKQGLGQGGFESPGRELSIQDFLEKGTALTKTFSGPALSTGALPLETVRDETALEYSVYRVKSGDMIGVLALSR